LTSNSPSAIPLLGLASTRSGSPPRRPATPIHTERQGSVENSPAYRPPGPRPIRPNAAPAVTEKGLGPLIPHRFGPLTPNNGSLRSTSPRCPCRTAMRRSNRKARIWLIDAGTLTDQSLTHAMQCPQVELISGLRCHELHRLPLHRLRDRLRVAEVDFLAFEYGQTYFAGISRAL
jgi:hypothetical protein